MRTLLALPAALLLAAPLAAQTVSGRVVDATSGAPVAEATVTVLNPAGRRVERVRTGADGAFEAKLDRGGTYRLRAERIGYQPSTSDTVPLYARETVEVTLRLSTEALAIDPLTVTARREPARIPALEMNGFYQRERMGFGRFLRREDFEGRFNRDMASLLSREPYVNVDVDRNGKTVIYFDRSVGLSMGPGQGSPPPNAGGFGGNQRRRAPPRQAPGCPPKVYLDGTPVLVNREVSINELISPEQVQAIEIFRGPSETPAQWRDSESACGVILIWSRAGAGQTQE